MMFDTKKLEWTREPAHYKITPEKIEITTVPRTDLWQRTYYPTFPKSITMVELFPKKGIAPSVFLLLHQ